MSITNERLHELARTANLDPFEVRALIAEVLALREQRDKVLAALDVYDKANPGDEWEHADLGIDLAASIRRALGVTEEGRR